jgi:dolichol kinase
MLFISALLLLLIPDVFRIYNRKYSIFSGVYKKVIRLKEFYTVGPQIYLTLACAFVFLLSMLGIFIPSIALAAMMIAAFGDAAAAIFGRKYGEHQFKTILQKDEKKSYEGLIAGFIVSYISAIFIVGPIIAILGALSFTILDYLNPKIADNVLNPILCSLTMMIPYWITLI